MQKVNNFKNVLAHSICSNWKYTTLLDEKKGLSIILEKLYFQKFEFRFSAQFLHKLQWNPNLDKAEKLKRILEFMLSFSFLKAHKDWL